MDRKKTILFVLEGEKREMGIFDNLSKIFFYGKSNVIPICVPAEMNIYMLYQIML